MTRTRVVHTPDVINGVMTATPILLRIPHWQYDTYDIDSEKEHIFWQDSENLRAFIDPLLGNLSRRYDDYLLEAKSLGEPIRVEKHNEIPRIFSSLKYKKTVRRWDGHFGGTMWEFGLAEPFQKSQLAKYMYETGLGERNASSGAGFLNIIKEK